MPDEVGERFAPEGALHDEDQEPAELTSEGLLSLEYALSGTSVRENAPARAARLETDGRLVDILRRDNFEGPRYQKTATGWGVPEPSQRGPGRRDAGRFLVGRWPD